MKKLLLFISLVIVSGVAIAQGGNRVTGSREDQLNKKYCSGLFSTQDATYFDFETDGGAIGAASYFNVLDWLQGRVAGLQVYTVNNMRVPYIRNNRAAIFVDEMRVDPGFLNMLPVSDIAMIKVMKSPFLGVWGGSGGAIAIYTRDGDEE